LKWFKHDTTALHDAKIEKLIMKYGIEGYGLYFACIEIIAADVTPENITFELEHDAEILAYKFKIDTLKVESIMKYCVELGLFEINGNNRITCMKLATRLDAATAQNPQIKETLKNFKKLSVPENNLHQIRLEEIRLDQNRSEKEREEPLNLSGVIETLRKEWNEAGLPKYTLTVITMPPLQVSDIARTLAGFNNDVGILSKAIRNYAGIRASPEHEPFPKDYGFPGFLIKGIVNYVDDAEPWVRFKAQTRESKEEQSRKEMVARYFK